jgi:hypothetical protein
MRLFILSVLVLATATTASAEPYRSKSRFGLGLELGAPTGLAGKYFVGGGQFAVQGGVGIIEGWGDDGLHIHAEALWHPATITRSRTVDIAMHVGVGGRIFHHEWGGPRACWDGRDYYDDCDDTHVGVRAPIGVSFMFNQTPMDLFVELALVVDVLHVNDDYMYDHDHAGLHGALGGRFYF